MKATNDRWTAFSDRTLDAGLRWLDQVRPALESTRVPGSRAWVVERVLVTLIAVVATLGIASGMAWWLPRWTPVTASAVWVGLAGALIVMAITETLAIRRAVRRPR